MEFYIWGIALYGAEICTLGNVNQKYLESFERKDRGISWSDLVKNKEALCGLNNNNNTNNNRVCLFLLPFYYLFITFIITFQLI